MSKRFIRFFSLMLASALLVSVCAGCNKQAQTAASTPASSQSSSSHKFAKPVTITISHCQGESDWPALEALGKAYTEETGNTIKWKYVSGDSYTTWEQAQLLANTEPDLIWGGGSSDNYKNGYIMDLAKYFNGKSAYTGDTWSSAFLDGMLEGCKDQNNPSVMLGVPIVVSVVNLYYNTDVLSKAGITEAPKSWGDVLTDCAKVKSTDSSIVPFSVMNSSSWNLGWIPANFFEDVYAKSGIVDKLDVITKDGKLDNPELVLGLKTGVLDPASQRFVDYFKLLKNLSQFFPKGFNTLSYEYEKLFNKSQAAFELNGSWYPSQHEMDGDTNKYDVTAMPYVDSSVSSYSQGKQVLYSIGAGVPDIAVTKKAKEDGVVDACIDFLQYWTDPSTGGKVWVDNYQRIPTIKGVEVPDILKNVYNSIGTTAPVANVANIFSLTSDESTEYFKMQQTYLEDNTTPEAFAAKFKKLVLKAADQYIEDNPDLKIESYESQVQ